MHETWFKKLYQEEPQNLQNAMKGRLEVILLYALQ